MKKLICLLPVVLIGLICLLAIPGWAGDDDHWPHRSLSDAARAGFKLGQELGKGQNALQPLVNALVQRQQRQQAVADSIAAQVGTHIAIQQYQQQQAAQAQQQQADAYYTNLNSPGYKEFYFKALCEQCGRVFTFTAEQWYGFENITCPHDLRIQDLKKAHNRHNNLAQQTQGR